MLIKLFNTYHPVYDILMGDILMGDFLMGDFLKQL